MKEWSFTRKLMRHGLVWTVLLLFIPLVASAETLEVSPEGMSLTEALSICSDGDEIVLSDGVYAEEREQFPLVVAKSVTLRAAEGASPVIDAPAFVPALRIEADHVTLQGLDIRFRRTGLYAIGDDMTVENCRISLAEEKWRTSSCGIWCGGIYRMCLMDCAFTGCGVSLAGPPLSESSKGLPVLTGLFEVGEDVQYFTSHTIEGCTVNGKPLFYAVSLPSVTAPADAGEIICCDCGDVVVQGADVSDCSMGMVLVYNDHIDLKDCRADRCGVFGIYVAKCGGGILERCSAAETNHGLDLRASQHLTLRDCSATDCDQGLFFSLIHDSVMVDCAVSGTGQGYFMAAGGGNTLLNCTATDCENGFNLQKEGHVLMTGCTVERCTVCGVRLDWTPTAFIANELKENWVSVMAYGDVSFDIAENTFEGDRCCALYLRDIAYSRFAGNSFRNCQGVDVQAIGTLGGSVWTGNTLDAAMDMAQAKDAFGIME